MPYASLAKRRAARALRHPPRQRGRPMLERFWEKVEKRGPDDCWTWIGAKDWGGYGVFWTGGPRGVGKNARATHVSWALANGVAFPADMLALHSCDNPRCVNPAHIRPGTALDNKQDERARGRMYSGPRPWLRLVNGRFAAKELTNA